MGTERPAAHTQQKLTQVPPPPPGGGYCYGSFDWYVVDHMVKREWIESKFTWVKWTGDVVVLRPQ